MPHEYSLWKVTFSYETPSEYHYCERETHTYTVVAQHKDEAEKKSFARFSKTPTYTDLDLSREGMVWTTVTKIQKRKIALPKLALPEDREHFCILPRVSTDGRSLEFLVTERKGR